MAFSDQDIFWKHLSVQRSAYVAVFEVPEKVGCSQNKWIIMHLFRNIKSNNSPTILSNPTISSCTFPLFTQLHYLTQCISPTSSPAKQINKSWWQLKFYGLSNHQYHIDLSNFFLFPHQLGLKALLKMNSIWQESDQWIEHICCGAKKYLYRADTFDPPLVWQHLRACKIFCAHIVGLSPSKKVAGYFRRLSCIKLLFVPTLSFSFKWGFKSYDDHVPCIQIFLLIQSLKTRNDGLMGWKNHDKICEVFTLIK